MPKEKFKIIKDFGNPRKSERRKYLETMMADMGLTSLDELRSDEERRRWVLAATPSPIVEKKLIEMGYSMNADTNIGSLGSKDRADSISGLYKVANLNVAASDLTVSIREFRSKVGPETSYEILRILSSDKLQDKNFSSNAIKLEIETVINNKEEDPAYFKFFIQDLVEKSSKYNSEYLKSSEVFERKDPTVVKETMDIDPNLNITKDHENRDQVAYIQQRLEGLGYNLGSYGVDGKFGDTTADAVVRFQQENKLPTTGIVDKATLSTLISNPKPFPVESRREHRRMQRQERLGGREWQRSCSPNCSSELSDSLTHVQFTSSRVDVDGGSPMLHELLKIINNAASQMNAKVKITSAYRGPYDQARIMYNNYKRRGVGSNRANKYLSSLYRRFPRISEIVSIFSGSAEAEGKRKAAEKVIAESWPKTGHRGGKSLDIGLGSNIKEVLFEAQKMATVDILRETDHFHVTVKSLTPGGIPSGKMRRFRK